MASFSPIVILEGAFALHFLLAVAHDMERGRWGALPFLLLFAAGFSYVTLLTLTQQVVGSG